MTVPAPRRPSLAARIGNWLKPAPRPAAQPTRRSYAAAQSNRLTEGWTSLNLSANAELHGNLDTLRARSRQLCRDNDYAKKFLQLVATNIVGPEGFRHQARVYNAPKQPDTPANEAIEAAFARWCQPGVADATGRHSFQGLCDLVIRSAARDGEWLVRIIRGKAAGNPWQLALQVLDADRLDTAYNRPAAEGQNQIRMGVEVNNLGRPVAYHLRAQSVNDPYQSVQRTERQRVPASEIMHGFRADRAEQLRGVPWMHASMPRLNNLSGYEEAAIVNARVGASKMGFLTKNADTPEVNVAQAIGAEADDGSLTMEADAGTIEQLPEGYKFEAFNPDYPTAMYADFVKAQLRAIASGLGVSYHALSGDLEGVSFSSIRSGTLEERDHWAVLQTWFRDGFLEPIYAEWMRNALGFGLITTANGSALPAGKIEKFSAHAFIGRRWDWVDPLRDIQADITAMDAGLTSPQAIVAKLGQDYEDTLVEIQAAQELRKKLGIAPRVTPNGQPMQPTEPPADPTPARHADALQQRHMELMAALLRAPAAAPAAPAVDFGDAVIHVAHKTEAPVVHVHVPEQRAAEIPAPIVNVHVPEQRAAEAPVINVSVQPAEVQIEATLAMPATRATSTVMRDKDDNITGTQTITTPL